MMIKNCSFKAVLSIAVFSIGLLSTGSAEARNYPENRFGGFAAFTLLDLEQVVDDGEDNPRNAEMGLGTVSLSFYSKFEDTRMKLKIDIDGKADEYGKLVEIAKISQKINDEFSLDFGKGKVKFHRYDYGVTEETYLDGGTILGRYELNWQELDKNILLALNYRGESLSSTTTLYADTSKVISKYNGEVETFDNGNPKLEELSNSVDPNDQFGIAQRFDLRLSGSTKTYFGFANYYHKYQTKRNLALLAGIEYDIYEYVVLGEILVGDSSQYRTTSTRAAGKTDWAEAVYRIQGHYRSSRELEYLLNLEFADYSYYELLEPYSGVAYDDITEGVLKKVDAGVAYHVSSRVTVTAGVLYEHLTFSNFRNDEVESHAWRTSSSLTYAF